MTSKCGGRSKQNYNFLHSNYQSAEQEVALNIVVCIKQVPDSAAKVVVDGGQVTWGDAPLVMNPWDEYAVEAAMLLL